MLYGGPGNDAFTTRDGDDIVSTGPGRDRIDIGNEFGSSGTDRILDFEPGMDRISFDAGGGTPPPRFEDLRIADGPKGAIVSRAEPGGEVSRVILIGVDATDLGPRDFEVA